MMTMMMEREGVLYFVSYTKKDQFTNPLIYMEVIK